MRTPKTLILLLPTLALLCAPRPAAAAAGAWASNPESKVRLITPWKTAPKDGELRFGLHFALSPGWHVYWKNSGDAGYPPVVVFAQAPGLAGAELLWPAPQRFELRGGLVAFGYEKEVVYPIRGQLQGAGDHVELAADVDYLVCEVDCVPYRYTLKLDQPLGATPVPDPETAPLIDAWWSRLPVAAEALSGVTTGGVLRPGAAGAGPVLEIQMHGVGPAAGASPEIFLETHEAFDTGKPAAQTTEDGVAFRVPLKPHTAGKPLPASTAFAWTATGLAQQGRPLSLEAKRTVPLGAPAAPAAPVQIVQHPTGLSPILIALLAVAALLAALWLWGVLSNAAARTGREALGFAAAAVVLGALWGLSHRISFVGLAWIELTLLAMALCAWLRRRAQGRPALRLVLTVGLAVAAAAAPWLAHRNRLTPIFPDRSSHHSSQEVSPS
jgi:DsbC/DsbD-like thiol-disulfide interchange protein